MTSEPMPGAGPKRRRRRRRRGGGDNPHAPFVRAPAEVEAMRQSAASARQVEDDKGKAFPEAKTSSIDFDRVARECLQARHVEIFDWLKRSLGKTSQELITEMVRGAVIKERVAFREAQGIVSSSSRDIEKLANR